MANMQQDNAKSDTICVRRPEPCPRGTPPTPHDVVLVDMLCVERKGWNQHESAGDQLIVVTSR